MKKIYFISVLKLMGMYGEAVYMTKRKTYNSYQNKKRLLRADKRRFYA